MPLLPEGPLSLCAVHDIYGFHSYTQGGMADYMLFPARALNYKVPADLPIEKAALIEPLACSCTRSSAPRSSSVTCA